MKHFQEEYEQAVLTEIFQMFPSTSQIGLKGVIIIIIIIIIIININ